ncbi:hypothetical protein EVAR_89042_1 [Eumeta japonica]|uniref:Uncharacterized protein n=1 Tax=Eumeta variegata TaxID=151549 RepID=A0A4C1Z4D1_EUMVA|nr:hypothetical protein EVAR_89042_1 [Eumeta japonica]
MHPRAALRPGLHGRRDAADALHTAGSTAPFPFWDMYSDEAKLNGVIAHYLGIDDTNPLVSWDIKSRYVSATRSPHLADGHRPPAYKQRDLN